MAGVSHTDSTPVSLLPASRGKHGSHQAARRAMGADRPHGKRQGGALPAARPPAAVRCQPLAVGPGHSTASR